MNNAEVLIKFKGDSTDADKKTKEMKTSIDGLTSSFTLASLAAEGITKMIQVFNENLGDAINRVDTLNNFPKVMSNLGISASKSQKVIDDLSEQLQGLPTSIDDAALAVQRFTSKNGDVEESEKIFLAVNNAILAGGAPMQNQAAALEQISQAYAKGKPDMMEWRTLMTAMPAQLKQVATAMGYADAALLGEAVRAKDGEKEFARMMDTMMRMNNEGVAGFKSFDEQARNATGGINTSIKNMKTAFTRGIANVIKDIDKGLKSFGGLNGVIKDIGKLGEKAFSAIGKAIKKTLPYVINIATWIKNNEKWLKPLVIGIGAAVAAFLTFSKVIAVVAAVKKAFVDLWAVIAANPLIAAAALAIAFGVALEQTAKKEDEFVNTHKKNMEEFSKDSEAIKNESNAWKDLQDQRQKTVDAGMTQLSHEQALYDELKQITDENGKIKKGYEDRAKFITGELSEALGVEIDMVGNVIKNYQGVQQEIEKAMEIKKAQILLNASEELYTEALKNQLTAQKDAIKYQEKASDAQKRVNEFRKEHSNLLEADTDKLNLKQKTEKAYQIAQLQALEKEADATKKNYEKQQKIVDNYYYEIGQYTKNYEHFKAGEYDKIKYIDSKYLQSMEATGDAEKQIIEDEIKTLEASLRRKEELNRDSSDNMYQQQIEDDKKRLDTLKQDLKKYESAWGQGLQNQLSMLSGKNVEFKSVGKGQVQAYVDGQKVGVPVAQEQAEILSNNIIKEFNKKQDAKQVGIEMVNGLANGVSDSSVVQNALNKAKSTSQKMVNSMKKALGIHSPSKITASMGMNLIEGFNVGINKQENTLFNKMNDISKGILSNLNANINASINPSTISSMQSMNVTPITNVYITQKQDPLGRLVQDVKTFSGGAKQDYLYGR